MNAPLNPKPDPRPSGSSLLAGAILGLGRALIGAFAGLVVVTFPLVIACDYFRLISFRDGVTESSFFRYAVGLGMVGFAFVAVVSGRAEIRGRAGSTIKGVLAGTAAGVVAGAAFGSMLSADQRGLAESAGVALGIFLGGPLGAIFGGMIGAAVNGHPPRKPAAKGELLDDDL